MSSSQINVSKGEQSLVMREHQSSTICEVKGDATNKKTKPRQQPMLKSLRVTLIRFRNPMYDDQCLDDMHLKDAQIL